MRLIQFPVDDAWDAAAAAACCGAAFGAWAGLAAGTFAPADGLGGGTTVRGPAAGTLEAAGAGLGAAFAEVLTGALVAGALAGALAAGLGAGFDILGFACLLVVSNNGNWSSSVL